MIQADFYPQQAYFVSVVNEVFATVTANRCKAQTEPCNTACSCWDKCPDAYRLCLKGFDDILGGLEEMLQSVAGSLHRALHQLVQLLAWVDDTKQHNVKHMTHIIFSFTSAFCSFTVPPSPCIYAAHFSSLLLSHLSEREREREREGEGEGEEERERQTEQLQQEKIIKTDWKVDTKNQI